MTTLEAVNEMLEAVGEPPVTALDTGGTSDEAIAEATLDREKKSILLRGWTCNSLTDQTYTPSAGTITLTNVLKMKPNRSQWGIYAIRDGKLYDVTNATATFTESVQLDVVLDIDFEDLSLALQTYIVKAASVKFQRALKRGTVDDAMNRDELRDAKMQAEREESDLNKINVLNTPEARRLRGDRDTGWVGVGG